MKYLWILSIVFLAGCMPVSWDPSLQPIMLTSPEGDELKLYVEVADDPDEREQGLMFRDHLPEETGMLFVFEEERPLTFWMKNTHIPLDIFYFDAQGNLVSMVTMKPCKEEPCRQYPSKGSAKYALEVNEGLRRKTNHTTWKLHLTQR